jgi:hypothetical protein
MKTSFDYLEQLNIIKKRRCSLTITDQERLMNLLGNGSGSDEVDVE